jgi:hypothetical protein
MFGGEKKETRGMHRVVRAAVVAKYRLKFLYTVEVVVIEVKASFQRPIGHASLACQKVDDLGEEVIEGHGGPFPRLAAAVVSP